MRSSLKGLSMPEQARGIHTAELHALPPSIELLQWLVRGSLKQNLLRSLRLWALIRFIYHINQADALEDRFTFAQWRSAFFSTTHPKGEEKPSLHDADCACAKTAKVWLFEAQDEISEPQWRQAFRQHYAMSEEELEALLQTPLFAMTRRSLQADLKVLTELGWLEQHTQVYVRVSHVPPCPAVQAVETAQSQFQSHSLNFLAPDVATLAQTFSQQINETQRFFLHVDYILSQDVIDQVDDWQDMLCEIWKSDLVLPVQLQYASARMGKLVQCIVYPVCLYYAQRAIYLCAFGETPTRQGEWYNYRLDRIQDLSPLQWTTSHLPQALLYHYQKRSLPTPDYIETEMAKAWGFDFYLPAEPMLIRFNRDFHDRYIQGTFRHDTFQEITYRAAEGLIHRRSSDPTQRNALLQVLHSRSPHDAYYQVNYRVGDTNVGHRLRAWRPNGEVLFPWALRQAIAHEVKVEFQLYYQEP
jgi:CRISPR-associated protein (TIGR03985 family)